MGERFTISAPLAKREIHGKDELRQLFFHKNKARKLVPLLVVPVEPKKQSQKQKTASSAVPTNVQGSRINTSPPQSGPVTPPNLAGAESAGSSSGATFTTLPSDVYWLIFNHLDDNADLTCMGLAMPHLWGIAQRIIHHRYKAMLGKWAGEKIILVGEDLDAGDYPADLFSAEEVEVLLKEVQVWDKKRKPERNVPITSIKLTYMPTTYETTTTIAAEAARVYYEVLSRYSRSPSINLREKLLWIFTDRPNFTPRDQAWTLRNLTTKEFVTAEGIALYKDQGTDVLKYAGQIGRGVWAGHRFDITTRSRHDKATKGEEWKDVSEEVKGEIVRIWESQFGPDWKDRGRLDERFAESVDDEDEDEDEPDVVHDFEVNRDYVVNVYPYYNRW